MTCSLLVVTAAAAQEPQAPEPDFELAPRLYVQIDWRGYPEWPVVPGTGRLNREAFEVRRARVGVDGRWRRTSFELTVDPQDEDGVAVKDAYAQVRFTRAVRLRVGQFKLPGSLEYGRSARSIEFMERTPVADAVAAGRDIGGMVTGEIGALLDYEAGIFAGDGNGRRSRAETTGAARVQFNVRDNLDVGTSFTLGRVEAVDTDDPNGLLGRAASGYRFFEQVYVDGLRTRAGADVDWQSGPWRLRGEFLRTDEQRREQGLDFEDLPRVVGTGWSAAVTRRFGRGPDRPRWREFEAGVRLDRLGFDDSGPRTEFESVRPRATDIRPRSVSTATVSIAWAPIRWTRVLTQASWEHYDETRTGPEPGESGFFTLGTRLQVGWE